MVLKNLLLGRGAASPLAGLLEPLLPPEFFPRLNNISRRQTLVNANAGILKR